MSTAQTIIDRALRLIGVIEAGTSPTSDETADALIALNAMISSWQTERLVVYAFVDTAYTLVASIQSYTVGPSGNFALTPRPPKIENAYVRASSIDYQVELIDKDRWLAIPDKTSESDIPMYAYYEPSLTTGTLKVWPVPNAANSLHIITWSSVSELATAGTSISLPPGYERALAYNLAIEISPEYKQTPSAAVIKIANDSKAAIKSVNVRSIRGDSGLCGVLQGQRSNIFSGGAAV